MKRIKKSVWTLLMILAVFHFGVITTFAAVGQPKIKKVKQIGDKEVTVSWSKVSGATGYVLEYRTGSGKWKENNTTLREVTIGKLKKNKVYQFRVRAYKAKKGKKQFSKDVYGKYSKVKKIKIGKLAKVNSFGDYYIPNGYYTIENRYTYKGARVLDIGSFDMYNRGNLGTFPNNATTNQIFYVQYNSGYYTIRALHSGKYVHYSDDKTTDNVHQYAGNIHYNAQWKMIPAGNSGGNNYYFLQNRGCSKYLARQLDVNSEWNNVYVREYQNLKSIRWRFIPIGRTTFRTSFSFDNAPSGTYDANDIAKFSCGFSSQYPVSMLDLKIYKDNYTYTASMKIYPNVGAKTLNIELPMSILGAGSYFLQVGAYNIYGEYALSNKYYFSVKGLNPTSDKRNKVMDYMRAMATVRWTPRTTFSYYKGGYKWYKGQYYQGIPYSQANRVTTYEAFLNNMRGNEYIGKTGQQTYMGSDCSSAVSIAWKQVDSGFTIRNTTSLQPNYSKIDKVGSYQYYSGYNNKTKSICTSNGTTIMYSSYRQLKGGDVIVKRNSGFGHAMMVINVYNDRLTVIEQTTYDKNLKSTWRVDKEYSFSTLYSEGYIPVRLSTMD